MKNRLFTIAISLASTLFILAVPINDGNNTLQENNDFWLGADISGTTQLESYGQQLYDVDGVVYENTALMKKYGLNAVRLRVWVNPRGGFCNQDDVLQMA